MGQSTARGYFCHLYINGQYWGLFNTCERPEASFGGSYFTGRADDFDVIKIGLCPLYPIDAADEQLRVDIVESRLLNKQTIETKQQ